MATYKTYSMTSEFETISIEGRKIEIPGNFKIVVSKDNLSQLLTFEINRYFNGIDMTAMEVGIKYINPNKKANRVLAVNVSATSEKVTFSWILDEDVACAKGAVRFSIDFVGETEHEEPYVWQTMPAQFNVEEGIWVGETVVPTP